MADDISALRAQEALDVVRRIYFPDWDTRREWRVLVEFDAGEFLHARHDVESKVLYVSEYWDVKSYDDNAKLEAVIAHNVGHILQGQDHGPRFRRLMRRVARKAEDHGRQHVALFIRDDILVCWDWRTGRSPRYDAYLEFRDTAFRWLRDTVLTLPDSLQYLYFSYQLRRLKPRIHDPNSADGDDPDKQ